MLEIFKLITFILVAITIIAYINDIVVTAIQKEGSVVTWPLLVSVILFYIAHYTLYYTL